jgi:3-hydroxyacyl-CoA dehydrogenase
MTQETVDAVLGKPIGLPPTGLYGLIDLIGLDVMYLVGKNLEINLPADDAGRGYTAFPDPVQAMYDRGQLGRKSGGGFAKMTKLDDGSRHKETFDLTTSQWRDAAEPDLDGVPGDLGEVMFADSAAGRLAWAIFGGTLRYAADLVPEIADDIVNVDNAIRWGFNWAHGPFETLDVVGLGRVIAKIEAEGAPLPRMLQVAKDAGAASFYRDSAEGRLYLGVDGNWHLVS